MGRITQGTKRFIEHPITKLCVGLILFFSGFVEAYHSFADDYEALRVGAHHGLMLFGFVNMLASIPDVLEGVAAQQLAFAVGRAEGQEPQRKRRRKKKRRRRKRKRSPRKRPQQAWAHYSVKSSYNYLPSESGLL